MARRNNQTGEVKPQKPGGHDPNRMTPQVAKVVTGGNTKCDIEWLEEMAAEISTLDFKPDDSPWDIRKIYQGYADEVNMEFFEFYRRTARKCTGIAYIRDERGGYIIDLDGVRLQRPCLRAPILGANVCAKHGGSVPHVKEAAQRRLAHAAEKAATTLITLTDPRDELNEIVDQKVRVSAANSVLDRVGIKGGVDIEIAVPGYKKVLESMFSEEPEEK